MKFISTLAATTFLAGAALAQDAGHITVTGEGSVAAVPDMATVMLGVSAQAETAKAAMDQTSTGVDALLATLAAAGIEARDIQTSGLSLNPVWYSGSLNSGPPEVSGYTAMNNVTVRVRALDSLGGVLDGVLEAGANTFNGLTFGLQDPEPRLDEARAAAVADARRKAELYAAAAGVDLGPVVSISEATAMQGPQPMFRRDMALASESVPVAAGETNVIAQVTIVWEIAE
jgi:uncharacterized protein YggE